MIGLTANSFNSVSLEPPLVLWSLSRAAASMPAFSAGSHYAINMLAADQKVLAERFALKGADRWAGVSFDEGVGGAPLLHGAAATFECFNRSRYEEGDHVIFVGEVERCSWRPARRRCCSTAGATTPSILTDHERAALRRRVPGLPAGQANHALYKDFDSQCAPPA